MNRPNARKRNVYPDGEQPAVWQDSFELSDSDQCCRWLLEISSDPILLHRAGLLILVNEAAVRLFGASSAEQLIGKPVRDFIHPEPVQEPIRLLDTSSRSIPLVECKLTRLDQSVVSATIVENHCSYQDQPAMQVVVHDVIDSRFVEFRTSDLAQYDLLTELPSRRQFIERLHGALARANRNRQLVGVIFLDLDHFKPVNAKLGYQAGDAVLKLVADRLKQCVREGDTVARLAGDEFSMILEGLADQHGAALVAQRALQALSRPLILDTGDMQIGVSIGIAVSSPDNNDLDTLLRHADLALCYAKESGRNTYQFYFPRLDDHNMAAQLRRAEIEPRLASLTPREREVLEMLIAGKSNKMIAYLLGTSSRTIENHRARIMDKMQAQSLPELVRMVLDLRGA